jgi:Mannosyl-glycoprotein endo-beta-N-acetylglucosaminidase
VRRPRFLIALLIVALAATAAVSVPGPASAQTDVEGDPAVVRARAELEAAQGDAHAAAARVEETLARRAEVEAQTEAVRARVAEIEAQIPVLQAQQRELRRQLRERAAILYRTTGPLSPYEALPIEPSLESVRRRHLADAAARQDHATEEALRENEAQLEALRADLQVQQEELARQRAELEAVQAQVEAAQREMEARVAKANQLLEQARTIGALRARGEPVMGPSVLTGEQMAAWWSSQSYSFDVPSSSIGELAALFIEEGQAENVRGDLAFAQSIIETGGFSAAPRNNFAGLGWCDSCSNGNSFPTPRDGIRAQIQHLRNYADPTSRAVALTNAPSPYWYSSDPATAARKFDTFFAKGWAPTWNDMGRGNWATDRSYSGKVLGVYQRMLAFAQGGG